jgi:hypothetical protein
VRTCAVRTCAVRACAVRACAVRACGKVGVVLLSIRLTPRGEICAVAKYPPLCAPACVLRPPLSLERPASYTPPNNACTRPAGSVLALRFSTQVR